MKPRDPGTLSGACHEINRVLGVGQVSVLAQVSESLVYQWADPDNTRLPTIGLAMTLDAAYRMHTGEEGPIACAWRVMAIRLDEEIPHVPRGTLEGAISAVKEGAEAVTAYTEAMEEADRKAGHISVRISDNIGCAALREIDEAVRAFEGLAKDIRAHMKKEPDKVRYLSVVATPGKDGS